MNIGIIGCGFIAEKHMKTIARCTDLSLLAVSDVEISKMEQAKKFYEQLVEQEVHIKAHPNYKNLLTDTSIDIVVVSVFSGLHAKIAKEAMMAGKHVIIEKPMTLSLKDAEEIIQFANVYEKKVLVCHQLRYLPFMQKIQKVITDGLLGELYYISVNLHLNRSKDYFDSSTWKGTWDKDGGMLVNQGIHFVDLMIWLLGDVQKVYGEIETKVMNKEIEDLASGILTFKNGAKGIIDANTISKPKNISYNFSIFGSKGTICLGGEDFKKILHCHVEGYPTLEDELTKLMNDSDEHHKMYKNYLKAIKEGTAQEITPSEGKKALEVIFAIYQSSLNMKPVTLPLDDFSTKYLG